DRFFLLPVDYSCTTTTNKTLRLYTVDNQQIVANDTGLAPYEITSDEAEAWLKAQLGDVLGELRTNLIEGARDYFARRSPSAHESSAELVEHAAAIETVADWVQRLSPQGAARLRQSASSLRTRAADGPTVNSAGADQEGSESEP
ncbi:MAG: hypothetical protein KDE58_31825, partial [Caldilineaceae bacterium]|nr:hypothetical protein [Caldilineaceae bacterium]